MPRTAPDVAPNIKIMKFFWGVLVLLCAAALADERRVLLRDIPTLLFEEGKMSTAFRTDPVPQLVQTAGPRVHVPRIWCKNAGWDGRRVLWECRLPDDVPARLGKFEVTCEGFERAGDPYILAGSCGIEYELAAAPRAAPAPSTCAHGVCTAPAEPPQPRASVRNAPPPEHPVPRRERESAAIAVVFVVIVMTALIVGIVVGFAKLTQPDLAIMHEPGPPPDDKPKRASDEITTEKVVTEMPVATEIIETYETIPAATEPSDEYDELPTKKTAVYDDLPKPTPAPEQDEGWSDLAMLGAAAGSFLVGRMTAPSRPHTPPRQRSPSPPPRRSSSGNSLFSGWSSSSSVGGSSTSRSSSGSSGWSSSSSVGGSKTR